MLRVLSGNDFHKSLKRSELVGSLLVTSPHFSNPASENQLIFLCAHDESGTIGLTIGHKINNLNVQDLVNNQSNRQTNPLIDLPVYSGGSIQEKRGFVLHSTDYLYPETFIIREPFAITATLDAFRSLTGQERPRHALPILGYTEWEPGELEEELKENRWLCFYADDETIFNLPELDPWSNVMAKLQASNLIFFPHLGHA